MTSRLPFFSLAFLLLSPLARASPIAHDIAAEAKRSNVFQVRDESIFTPVILISYSTPITSPVNGETFTAGGPGSISWNATLPFDIKQSDVASTARLVLGYLDDTPGYHLDTLNPIATNIPLYTAPSTFSFTFPANLPTRSTYLLALMGSSGNVTPVFTITGAAGSSAAASSSSTASSSQTSPSPAAPTSSSAAAPAPTTTAEAAPTSTVVVSESSTPTPNAIVSPASADSSANSPAPAAASAPVASSTPSSTPSTSTAAASIASPAAGNIGVSAQATSGSSKLQIGSLLAGFVGIVILV